jgi:hypothetical protein
MVRVQEDMLSAQYTTKDQRQISWEVFMPNIWNFPYETW